MIVRSKHSIRRKLTRIMMVTSATAVLLACLGFGISDLVSLRNGLVGDLSTLAQVVGSNSIAALTFGDRQGASEVLNALRAKPSIVAAGIYNERGEPFARYEPNPSISIPRVLLQDGFHDKGGRLELFYGIRLGHKRIGTLYIASDWRDRDARLKQYAMIAIGIVLVSMLLAFVLSSRLQRNFSEPIVELARVASLVSRDKNYSTRANPRRFNEDDEIDDLMTGFNSMLAEIEQRDSRLLIAKNSAEKAAEINAQLARESALILNSASDGIMGVGVDRNPTFLNPAGARILHRSLDDFHGKSIHDVIHHSRADGTQWTEAECPFVQAMLRGETVVECDDTFWRPDGSSFPVSCSGTPMFDGQGKRLGIVMTFRDVTERRAIERLKSEFVSTVSHELRTPLTSIRGALGLLSSGMLGTVAEKGRRMLEIAVANTDRLVRLINDILDLERIESGKVELARSAVDVQTILTHVTEGLQSIADEARVRLVVEPAGGALFGDSDRIIQTLTNLVGNAIKFSPPDTTVMLSASARVSDFLFCVADQGRGVPEGKLESIFDRFSQVDASDSRDKGGSGLGLAICQSIVNAHGGKIWAEKNDPVGTRFLFTIPVAPSAKVALRDEDTNWHITGTFHAITVVDDGVPSVLVVEDDLDLARVMITALQSHEIRTYHAASGGEAVRLCGENQPSLIVLDLLLPDMDGFAVVNALRKSPGLGRTPLLVYSALDVGSADQSRLRLGPTEFLTKSRCTLAEFEAHVVRLLETVTNKKYVNMDAA